MNAPIERRSFVSALASVCIGGSAIAARPDDSAKLAPEATSESIRIVSWNVACGQWCTPKQVSSALIDRQPDLVLTNETPKFNRGVVAVDWSQDIARRLGLSHVYVGSVSSANHRAPDWGDVTGSYGGKFKSILSRWPISNTHEYVLDGVGWSPASAIRVEVRKDETSWAVYSLHLPGHREWEPSKHRTLAKIVKEYEPLENVIVGGDFNVRTRSEVLQRFQEEAGLTNAITSPAIDHILFKSKEKVVVKASGIEAGPTGKGPRGGLSDHPYAWAEIQ